MKAVFVGNIQTYKFLKVKIRPNWDWQMPLPSIQDFWNAYDDNKLDENTNIIVISSEFYEAGVKKANDNLINDFLNLVVQSSSTALTCIVDYFHDNNKIDEALLKYAGASDDAVLDKYWWLDPQHCNPSLDAAIKEYINLPSSDQDNVNQISDSEGLHPSSADDDDEDDEPEDMYEDYEDTYEEEKPYFSNNYHKKAHIITVTSTKGGAGKTSTAVGMGTWLSMSSRQAHKSGMIKKPLKICIVDLDVNDGQIGSMIGKARPTMMNIATIDNPTQDQISHSLVEDSRLGLSVLLSPKLPDAANGIPIQKYKDTISKLRYMFDVIILDTSINHLSDICKRVAYPMANNILFVTTLDRKAVMGMAKWIMAHSIRRTNDGYQPDLDMNKVGVSINQAMKDVSMSAGEIKKVIEVASVKSYQQASPNTPVDQIPQPKLIGAVPEIPNGILIKESNMQQFDLAMSIPPFAKSIGKLARILMPEAFKNLLPDVDPSQA